jgi:sugar (pentulose or hexulose) kinase
MQTNVPVIRFETSANPFVSGASEAVAAATGAEAVRGEGVSATSGTIIRTTAAAKKYDEARGRIGSFDMMAL